MGVVFDPSEADQGRDCVSDPFHPDRIVTGSGLKRAQSAVRRMRIDSADALSNRVNKLLFMEDAGIDSLREMNPELR